MNRYSPYFDHDEYCTGMTIDDRGSWVHVHTAESLLRERNEARAEVERLKAEREEALGRVEHLEETIRDNIPYAYDQGEPDEDEATPEECVEYAAGEIAQLKTETERLRAALRLLWEEAQDKCVIRDATFDAVEMALREGDR